MSLLMPAQYVLNSTGKQTSASEPLCQLARVAGQAKPANTLHLRHPLTPQSEPPLQGCVVQASPARRKRAEISFRAVGVQGQGQLLNCKGA